MDRIPLALAVSLFAFLGCLGVHGAGSLRLRLEEMERAALQETRENHELKGELARLEAELAAVGTTLEEREERLAEAERLAAELSRTKSRLDHLGRAVATHDQRLESVARSQESFDPEAIESNLKHLEGEMSARWETVHGMAATAAELADASQRRLEELGVALASATDPERKWNSLLGPVVQLSGEESVGSGIVVRGAREAGSEEEVDYILTAWHVVRDIQGSLYNRDMPVPVRIYLTERDVREETAELLEFDPMIDLALLRLDSETPCENFARLADLQDLAEVRIFDPIYAVGCPLGNDPIPTLGQIAALSHLVDSESYMMINAPTYVGNSGGGIFSADEHELLGVFSKVYTHGSLRPTIVTHMGLVTPMAVVYDWLQEVGYDFLVPGGGPVTAASTPREVRGPSAD